MQMEFIGMRMGGSSSEDIVLIIHQQEQMKTG